MLKRHFIAGLALLLCLSLLIGCVPADTPDTPTTDAAVNSTPTTPSEEACWNSDIKVIPTPLLSNCTQAVKPITGFSEIICNVTRDETVAWGLEKLQEVAGGSSAETLTLQFGDDAFFEEKNAAEQGYLLTRDTNGVTITAKSSVGILYGLMTLRQLCEEAPETFQIYDRPQIRFRGNMNTLWAESGVWSFDFGDGIENAKKRIMETIDEYALTKMNLMYADAFGFNTERFPGYDDLMQEITAYAKVRGVRVIVGGYGMGYGMSAHKDSYMGIVFYNRTDYPNGEIYKCIGTSDKAREHGTCLSNDALTDAKIEEIRNYLRATGVNTLYLHNVDDDVLSWPLWGNRCKDCKEKWPSSDWDTADGAAGAFAYFYNRILDALLPEFPDLIICPVSPGYAYADSTSNSVFGKSCAFWSAVYEMIDHKENCIPMFREQFYQQQFNANNPTTMRFDELSKTLPSYSVVYFSSGDGFYSDNIYTPSAAYAPFMKDADLVLCANGSALQKPTMVANAEYLWNPTDSAFWNLELMGNFQEQFNHYNQFREGMIRPEGIYGEDGLLDASCELLFGKEHGKQIAEIYRLQGKNGESPVLTACNVELWTNYTKVNFPMLWDTPVNADQQQVFLERFSESARLTTATVEILEEILSATDLTDDQRAYLQFMYDSAILCAELCTQLTRYMELYIEADRCFTNGETPAADLCDRAKALQNDAQAMLKTVQESELKAFDPLGGILVRRDEMFEFVSYCAGQIVQSIETNSRIPADRRPPNIRDWW